MANPSIPDEVKKVKGTFRKDRELKSKPKVEPGIVPSCPEELDADHVIVWNRLKIAVEQMGVYANGDYDAFMNMVLAVVLSRRIPEHSMPKDVIAFRKQAKEHLEAFGLTPQSRSKTASLGQKEVVDDDPLAEFVN
jgi:hypothetical protein